MSLLKSDNIPDSDSAISQPIAENIKLLRFTYVLVDETFCMGTVLWTGKIRGKDQILARGS